MLKFKLGEAICVCYKTELKWSCVLLLDIHPAVNYDLISN